MSVEHWMAFAAASGLLLALPGPAVLLVVSYAVGQGRRTALATITGVTLGDFAVMTVALGLLFALIRLSPDSFVLLQWLGSVYMMVLAVRIWRDPPLSRPVADNDNLREDEPIRILGHAFAVAAFNPKNLAFFTGFMSLFIDTRRQFLTQALTLELTFLALALVNCIAYACFAERARNFIRRHMVRRDRRRPRRQVLIASASVTAAYRRIAA